MIDLDLLAGHFGHPRLQPLAAQLADKLAGRRILVCGASGFVGTWILAALTWYDRIGVPFRATALARNMPDLPGTERWLTPCSMDLVDARFETDFDLILHAALPTDASVGRNAGPLMTLAVSGTLAVLGAAARNPDSRLLYLSSGAVYGDRLDHVGFSETDFKPIDPRAPGALYAEAKRAAEALCAAASRDGQQIVVARLFSAIGAGYRAHAQLAAISLLDDALSGRPIRISGDGLARRSYLYGAELALWLLYLLIHGEPGDAVNVGSDEVVSILELAQHIAAACGRSPSDIVVEGRASTSSSRVAYWPSLAHARARYGLEPRLPLAEALRLTVVVERASAR